MPSTTKSPNDMQFASAAKSKIATIYVGPKEVKYRVHSDLLTHHSDYFRAALTGNFKEAETQTVEFLDVNTKVFELFIDWLYTQKVSDECLNWDSLDINEIDEWTSVCQKVQNSGHEPAEVPHHYTHTIVLYALADRFRAPRLQNSIIDYLMEKVVGWGCIQHDEIEFAFEILPEQSPLLNFIVTLCCDKYRFGKNTLCNKEEDSDQDRTQRYEELPAQFHLAVSKFCMRHGDIGRWFDMQRSKFYTRSANDAEKEEKKHENETESIDAEAGYSSEEEMEDNSEHEPEPKPAKKAVSAHRRC